MVTGGGRRAPGGVILPSALILLIGLAVLVSLSGCGAKTKVEPPGPPGPAGPADPPGLEALEGRLVWPVDNLADVPPDDYFIVQFDKAVDPETLAGCAELRWVPGSSVTPLAGQSQGGSGEPGAVIRLEVFPDQNGDPATYELRPAETLAPLTLFELVVGSGVVAADGRSSTKQPLTARFTTAAPGGLDSASVCPAWSPGGSEIAWTAPAPGALAAGQGQGPVFVDLWIGALDGMAARRAAQGVRAATPAWSADGRRLYYPIPSAAGDSIARLDLASGTQTTLLGPDELRNASPLRLAGSPDGAFLAIEACFGGVDAHSDVMQDVLLYDLEAGRLSTLPGDGLTSVLVGWRGEELCYATTYENYDQSHHFRYNLCAFDPAGATRRVLLPGGQLENPGGYSVAGGASALAYWTWEAQSLGRWIVHRPKSVMLVEGLARATAGTPVLVAGGDLASRYRQVALSPDGRTLAAARMHEGSWDVVVMGADGQGERVIASGASAQFAPSWSPEGDQLAYFEVGPGPAGASLPVVAWKVVVSDPLAGTEMVFDPAVRD